jgi:hypothetical protein
MGDKFGGIEDYFAMGPGIDLAGQGRYEGCLLR